MPAPTSVNEFLDLLRKSGLLEADQFNPYFQQLKDAGKYPSEPRRLARYLVRDGWLTFFQAEQLLLGKSRGFTLGRYDVLERLGTGGMGIVYLCRHRFMRRLVAVKVLSSLLFDDPVALERFYREAECVAALDHPNIVRAYDIDRDGPFHFLAMEYVEGASLEKMVRGHGPTDVRWATCAIRQAAVGLQHAHEAGLVHRDIKPANLLVDKHGVVKILDLGLARFFQAEVENSPARYNQLLGTADYIAPEQAVSSESADIRADIYSLGATFHFLLVGRPPFDESTLARKLIAHQMLQPKPITALRPEVPADLVVVIEKMMAKDPSRRYTVPAEVIEALAPWTKPPLPEPPLVELPRLSPAALRVAEEAAQATRTGRTTAIRMEKPTQPMRVQTPESLPPA